jgi:hypothetical protein
MGFRFFRRIKIAPGLSLNLSKRGASVSLGPRGAKLTMGTSGVRTTLGIPGTGLYYTRKVGTSRQRQKAAIQAPAAAAPSQRLDLGFFQRLFVPEEEKQLMEGLKQLTLNNLDQAFENLSKSKLADAAFAAGFISLKRYAFETAVQFLRASLAKPEELGKYFQKYRLKLEIELPITEEITAHIEPNPRGALLALVEALQHAGKTSEAETACRSFVEAAPGDVVGKLSLVELLLDKTPSRADSWKEVVALCEGVANESPLHCALLLYKARALRNLNLLDASLQILNQCLRKSSNLNDDLRKALRYERTLLYESAGQARKAKAELQKLYADQPDYEDVAKRLEL